MPPMLRKRINCHYCGQRLNATQKLNSKINCTNCLADNYLDAQNQITDVPASEATRLRGGSAQPVEKESTSDVFCKTCLTNQSFYQQALANYLPEEDDPRYEELDNAFPEFKRELELRYPQCCVQCAPKVQARIQIANYAAKTDHLRRTVRRRHGRQASPFRSFLISLAGLGHLTGLVLQLIWHGTAAVAVNSTTPETKTNLATCLRSWPVTSSCANTAASSVRVSLAISLFCLWWNPEWQQRLSGREGRLRGLRSYYLTQLSMLALRFSLWFAIQKVPNKKPYASVIHAMAFVFLLISSCYAQFGMIYLDTTPVVDWSKVNRPLVDPNQFQPPVQRPVPTTDAPRSSQFSIGSLAGQPRSIYEQWQPPTPPGDDSMDWAPTSHAFKPRPRPMKPRLDQPSPFYGALPAAPVRGSLDPKRPEQPDQQKAIGVPPGFFGLSKTRDQEQNALSSNKPEISFAPASFFAHEREADTGLENIFDKMFSVRDHHDPTPANKAREMFEPKSQSSLNLPQLSSHTSDDHYTILRMLMCCSSIIVLVIMIVCNHIVDYVLPEAQQSPSNLMHYAAFAPALDFLDWVVLSRQDFNRYLAIPLLQGLVLALSTLWKPSESSAYVPLWNKLVTAAMFILLLQKVYRLCQLPSPTMSRTATAHMNHSVRMAEKDVSQQMGAPVADFGSTNSFASQSDSQRQRASTPNNDLPRHAPPESISRNPFASYTANTSPIRKQASDESISSVSSVQTTSTAPGWKTPHNESRTYDYQEYERNTRRPANAISRGLGGLTLDNDFGLGSGTGIAGPRTRSQGQGSRNVFGNGSYGR